MVKFLFSLEGDGDVTDIKGRLEAVKDAVIWITDKTKNIEIKLSGTII